MRFAAQQPGIAQFLTSGPDYGGISDLGMQARSKERQTGYKAEANIRVNALDAMAKIKAAKHEAKGIIAGGQAQASATQAQGLSSMFSNIAYGAARFKKPGGKEFPTPPANNYMNQYPGIDFNSGISVGKCNFI